MTRVVALEGLPFTGKTSSAHHARRAAPEWTVIAEYHDLLDAETVPDLSRPPESSDTQSSRVEIYLELDRRRWEAARCSLSHARPVLMDRCHLSIVAYSIALNRCFGIGTPHGTAARYDEAINEPSNPIAKPDAVILLDVTAEVAADRLQRLKQAIDPRLATLGFVTALIEAYRSVLTVHDGTVQTIDASLPLPDVQANVLATLTEVR